MRVRRVRAAVRGLDPATYLQPSENVLASLPRHRASAVPAFVGILLAWAGSSTAAVLVSLLLPAGLRLPVAAAALALLLLLHASLAVATWLRVATSRTTITDQRVYHAYGRLRYLLLQTTYDRVTDLHVKQGLLGRARGYGTVVVQTAGAGIALVGIPDPFGAKDRIERAREAHVRTLIAEHAPARAAATASTAAARGAGAATATPGGVDAPAAGAPIVQPWQGRPTASALLPHVAPPVLLLVIGLPVLMLLGTVSRLAWPLSAFLIFSSLGALRAIVRHQTSRYEVGERGVAVSVGWLSRRRVETTYGKITDTTVEQGLLGRMLGFGQIRINTAGSNDVPILFEGVREPEAVKAILDAARRQAQA